MPSRKAGRFSKSYSRVRQRSLFLEGKSLNGAKRNVRGSIVIREGSPGVIDASSITQSSLGII